MLQAVSGLFYTILLTFLANYKPWALKEQETQGSLSVSSVHLGQKSRLKQGRRWEATSFLWIKGRGLGRGNRLFPVRTFWIRPPWHASAHRQLGRGQARQNQDLGPASEKRACARGSGQEGWQRGGAAPLRLRTKTPRRKWCTGVWRCEDLPGRWRPRWPAREQDRRRRRRWQRRSWEGGSRHVSSGRTGVGVHAVSAEKVDTHVRVAGARADLLGIVGASASGKSILQSWPETAAPTSLACCLGLNGLPDSLDCFCCSKLLPGLCPVLRYPAPVCLATKELFLQSY